MSRINGKHSKMQQTPTILGLGACGFSVARHLHGLGLNIRIMDSRKRPPYVEQLEKLAPHAQTCFGEFRQSWFADCHQIVLSPGLSHKHPAIAQGIADNHLQVINDIEMFAASKNPGVPVIAITGTNGKSTVTKLMCNIANHLGCKTYAGGNFSPPALDLLKHNDAEMYILELSSFQLEHIHSLSPRVSIVLNISSDHMDRYTSILEYFHTKMRIHHNSSFVVHDRDCCPPLHYINNKPTISFGADSPAQGNFGISSAGSEGQASYTVMYGKTPVLSLQETALEGATGALNLQAALAITAAMSWNWRLALPAVRDFSPLEHRCECMGFRNRVRWINDSKATNVDAAVCSLQQYGENTVLICGGRGKNSDYTRLSQAIAKYAKKVILLGEDADKIAGCIKDAGTCLSASSLRHAVTLADQSSSSGDTVLLAPACSSLDMFTDYAERGEKFREFFGQLEGQK